MTFDQPASPQSGRLIAMFTHGFGNLAAGSVACLAGDHPAIVNDAVEQLLRAQGRDEARLRKLVPILEREDLPGIGDLQFLLGVPHRRVCGRVLSQHARQGNENVDAALSFVVDCLEAWSYDRALPPAVVIVELDDFFRCAGVEQLEALMLGLAQAASRFRVALLAIANTARAAIFASASRPTPMGDIPSSPPSAPVEGAANFDGLRAGASQNDGSDDRQSIPAPKRTRDPHARDTILGELSRGPSTPAELAARMSNGNPSKKFCDNVRQHLHHLKRDGLVVSSEGRYRVAPTIARTSPLN